MPNMNDSYFSRLVRELVKMPTETEWVEFKQNNADPQEIAEYISALSNSAVLCRKSKAYLVWGVDDVTHEVVGTSFRYREAKKGNEELEAWLARMVNPAVRFRFAEGEIDGSTVCVLEIPAAAKEPTKLGTVAYIRIGSNKKPLAKHPDRESELWHLLDTTPYEDRLAVEDVTDDEILNILDYPTYYRSLGLPISTSAEKVLGDFEAEGFIARSDAGSWGVTNLGALVLAVDLTRFKPLAKRSVRVIKYGGVDRMEGVQERTFTKGYAASHEEVVQFIMAVIPQEEVLVGATRKAVVSFPEVAVRELVANMMIHQALEERGASLMVEIFSNRIEFTNPGTPLVPIDRIVDIAPRTRNDGIATFMHKCGICEERGSGYDKIVGATCRDSLLAPRIVDQAKMFTKVVLYSKVPFNQTSKDDRVRTCYMLACLAMVNATAIGNSNVRGVFGMDDSERAKAGRVIKDAISVGLIKPVDPDTAPRHMRYVPYWA